MFISNYTCFKILDVYEVSRKAERSECKSRPWSAISCREYGESVFESDSKRQTADAGSVLYIPSGVDFSRESTSEKLIIIHMQCYEKEERNIEVLHHSNPSAMYALFYDIYKTWEEKKPGYEHRCTAMLHMLMAKLIFSYDNILSSHKQVLIKPGADYIDSNFDNPEISVRWVAEMCNISEEYFRKLYKEAYGISPHQAIVDKRIQKSCRLLQSGDFTVETVAEQSGFQDCKYFSTLFRKIMKMTPKEYKWIYNN